MSQDDLEEIIADFLYGGCTDHSVHIFFQPMLSRLQRENPQSFPTGYSLGDLFAAWRSHLSYRDADKGAEMLGKSVEPEYTEEFYGVFHDLEDSRLFLFLLENLPCIAYANGRDIMPNVHADEGEVMPEYHLVLRPTFQHIQEITGGLRKKKQFLRAAENLRRIPAKLLDADTIDLDPIRDYALYKRVFDDLIEHSFGDAREINFKRMILRDRELIEKYFHLAADFLDCLFVGSPHNVGELLFKSFECEQYFQLAQRVARLQKILRKSIERRGAETIPFHLDYRDDHSWQQLEEFLSVLEKTKTAVVRHLGFGEGVFIPEQYQLKLREAARKGNIPWWSKTIEVGRSFYASFDLFNASGDCLAAGGSYQKFTLRQMEDPHIGQLGIYEGGRPSLPWGKAILVNCKDEKGKPVLCVDGVVFNEDLARILDGWWQPLVSKTIIETALQQEFEDIMVNVYHNSAHPSTWSFLPYWARLAGLRKNRDYKFHSPSKEELCTSGNGFELVPRVVENHCHYLEKVVDETCPRFHFLAGFAINHQLHCVTTKKVSPVPSPLIKKISALPHDVIHSSDYPLSLEKAHVNNGRGYILGILISAQQAEKRFNRLFGNHFSEVHHYEVQDAGIDAYFDKESWKSP